MIFAFTIPSGPLFDPRAEVAFQSLSNQSGPNVEVVAAFCECSESLEAHELSDQHAGILRYRRHGPDHGQADAIQEGWNNIDGDVFGWLNVDDRLADNALQKVATTFLSSPEIDVVYGQSIIEDDNSSISNPSKTLHPNVEAPSDLLYRSNIISQPSCFIRKSALERVGWLNRSLHYTMDWDLWVRLLENGAHFNYIDDVLSIVYYGRKTKTGELNLKRVKEIWKITRRNSSYFVSAKTLIGFTRQHFSI